LLPLKKNEGKRKERGRKEEGKRKERNEFKYYIQLNGDKTIAQLLHFLHYD